MNASQPYVLRRPAPTWGHMLVLAVALFLSVPIAAAQAAVAISEVAWMGSGEDANAEWIELANDGAPVDVTGWTLVAADGQPNILLEGTVPQGYSLLERTDDDTVPGVSAFFIYTGALGNSGETLILRDGSGVAQDEVVGGEDWALGGNNDEKLTLQRSGGGWVTAVPTPGSANARESVATLDASVEGDSTGASGSSAATGGTKSSSKGASGSASTPPTPLVKIPPALYLDIGTERTVSIGAPVRFVAKTTSETGRDLDIDSVTWNMGDGSTKTGNNVAHRYKYAGDYAVVAHAKRAQLRENITAEDRVVVHVREAPVAIAEVTTLTIAIRNESSRDIDLSGFLVTNGDSAFRIPDNTVLLSGSSIPFPAEVTKLVVTDPNAVALFYPDRTLAAWYGDTAPAEEVPLVATSEEEKSDKDRDSDEVQQGEESVSELANMVEKIGAEMLSPDGATGDGPTQAAAVAYAFGDDVVAGGRVSGGTFWWYLLGLVALVGVAGGAVVLTRRDQEEALAAIDGELAAYELDEWPDEEVTKPTRRKSKKTAL